MDEEKAIQKYIDEKKELYNLVLQIIDKSEADDYTLFQELTKFLDRYQSAKNKSELEHFLYLISNISINHRRGPNFFEKIEKILTISSKFYDQFFSNQELFTIFQQNKPILLFQLKSKNILIDQILFEQLVNFKECIEGEINYYFYPELDSTIKSGIIENINEENFKLQLKEDIEIFERNRQKFENESYLCSIIREDLIDDFIQYVHNTNISLSFQIKRSLFETHSIFIEKDPTLIEYAAFFGSIQIMKYLAINDVKLTSSIWLYAVHSDDAEIIQFLEEKQIKPHDRTFSEAIKCHHNDIAHYIYDNYFDISFNITDLSDDDVLNIYSSSNYEFFSNEIDGNKIFFSLCKNGYYEVINLYLALKKKEIDKYISDINQSDIKEIIHEALINNKLDVVYHLLLGFDSIPREYFKTYKEMTKIVLPNTIKIIQDYAFSKCSSLTQIIIPSSLTLIKDSAFSYCQSLKEIIIPSSVTSIGDNAFSECLSLANITIPSSVTSIGDNAFCYCQSLKQIIIPSSVTLIKNDVFLECSSLTNITIPSSVTLNGNPFTNCAKLHQVTIIPCKEKRIEYFEDKFLIYKSQPDSEIYDILVWFKPTLRIANIPDFIKTIGNFAFSKCLSLTQCTIPSSVTTIGYNSFYECLSLTQIIIPSSVTFINNNAFSGCRSLKQITIPSSVTRIGEFTFIGCRSLTQITIPSSVTYIGHRAFSGCRSLTQITIPSSVKRIGKDAFSGCSSLTQITIPSSIDRSYIGIKSIVKVTVI